MTDNIKSALNRREQRKLARDKSSAATVEQAHAEVAALKAATPPTEPVIAPVVAPVAAPIAPLVQTPIVAATTAAVAAVETAVAQTPAAQVVKHNVRPTRAEQRREHVAQSIEDGARVPVTTEIDMEIFRSRKPTLHELNQIAKQQQSQAAEEARLVAGAAAKAAHGALLGLRQPGARDAYADKHASQQAMDAARAAAAAAVKS